MIKPETVLDLNKVKLTEVPCDDWCRAFRDVLKNIIGRCFMVGDLCNFEKDVVSLGFRLDDENDRIAFYKAIRHANHFMSKEPSRSKKLQDQIKSINELMQEEFNDLS